MVNVDERCIVKNEKTGRLGQLTRQQLKELEEKEKTRGQKVMNGIIMVLPVVCGFIAIMEYWEIPNGSPNSKPYTYAGTVVAFMLAYAVYALAATVKKWRGDKTAADKVRHKAPLFSALFLLFLSGLSSISKTTQAQQQASLAAAIRRSAVHCYATEGAYPASLSYLKEHYGIRYDEKKYLVDYEVFASNLMPEITVIART